MRVLVTGASGTLGCNVVRLLKRDAGYDLHLPLRTPRPDLFHRCAKLSVYQLDLRNSDRVFECVRTVRPDVVVHCAASGLRPPRPEWFEMSRLNVDASLRLFEACCGLPDCHFIYISTGLVYREQGRPLNELDPIETLHPYGSSKSAADGLLRAAATEFGRGLTLLRPFSFTGPHDGGNRLFPSLLNAAAMREPFHLSPGGQVRDFCAVSDIALAVAAAIKTSVRGQIRTINLGSGTAEPLRDLVMRVCEEIHLAADLHFGARPYQPLEPMHLVADISKAKEELHWRPDENIAHAVWALARELNLSGALTEPHPHVLEMETVA